MENDPVNILKNAIVILGVLVCMALASEPNFIKTTIKSDLPENDIVTKSYGDGLGKKIQHHIRLNGLNAALIAGSIHDEVGRPWKEVLPYVSNECVLQYDADKLDVQSNEFYSQELGMTITHAYSESRYYPSPLMRVKVSGAAGKPFSVDPSEGHPSRVWFLGVPSPGSGYTELDAYFERDKTVRTGFIKSSILNDIATNIADTIIIEQTIPQFLKDKIPLGEAPELSHYLTVSMGPNKGFSQELKDGRGNVVATWADPNLSEDYDEIRTQNTYDILGNLREEIDPLGLQTIYSYNKLGQLEEKNSPDAGKVTFTYDELGRVIETVNENFRSAEKKLVSSFDAFGRDILVSVHRAAGMHEYVTPKIRKVFDVPDDAAIYIQNTTVAKDLHEAESFIAAAELKNTKGRLVAIIAYGEECLEQFSQSPNKEPTYTDKIIELFSYDIEGRVDKKYKLIPSLPMHVTQITYDIQGKVLTETVDNGSGTPIVTQFTYTPQQQLYQVIRNGKVAITHQYNEIGQLIKKLYGNGENDKVVQYKYTLRGWTKKIAAGSEQNKLFYQTLEYEEGNQYNGNIARSTIEQEFAAGNSANELIDCNYRYDNVNRLTSVHNKGDGSSTLIDDDDDNFDAAYSYDVNGRIVSKKEGLIPDPQNPETKKFCDWGAYEYYDGKNQLKNIENSPRASIPLGASEHNFIYDKNGNMIWDRYKKMVVTYDWRDLPVQFTFYDTKNAVFQLTSDQDVKNIDSNTNFKKLWYVTMKYDANGNRVLKKVYKKG